MKKFILLLFVMFSLSIYAQDQALQQSEQILSSKSMKEIPKEVSEKIADFFKTIQTGNVQPAYDKLLLGSPLLNKNEELGSLVKQTIRSFELYGLLKDYELVGFDAVSSSYMRVKYLGIHTKYPLRWMFTFYKSPEKGWIVTNIKFDDLSEYYFND